MSLSEKRVEAESAVEMAICDIRQLAEAADLISGEYLDFNPRANDALCGIIRAILRRSDELPDLPDLRAAEADASNAETAARIAEAVADETARLAGRAARL